LRLISARLRQKRFKSGSLNIEIPEAEFTMGEGGIPSNISTKKHLKTHELVEDFMLLANRVIAQRFSENDKSLMYRNHGKPEAERLIALNGLLAQMGDYKPLSISQNINASEFQRVLDQVTDPEVRHMIEIQLLRTMPKADYSLSNKGHFGLNFDHYCHFTSPIRRYPDIMVHRALSNIPDEDADKVASSSTQSEITAMKAEREYNKIKQLRYLQGLPPRIYGGIVNGMTQRGLFIMLEDIFVDGFVRAEWMDDDYYYFDENKYVFIGRRYKTKYRVGQKVKVKIRNISVIKQKLDLLLVD
jgi:ribonuclease R